MSATDREEVSACPECDSSNLQSRAGEPGHLCAECGEEFVQPVKREPRRGQTRESAKPIKSISCYNCGCRQRTRSRQRIVCSGCGSEVSYWRARISYFGNREKTQEIADGPIVGESPKGEVSNEVRKLLYTLEPPGGARSTEKGRPIRNLSTVYYLEGDLRAAIRLFIRENEEYIEDCLQDTSNPFSNSWSEERYVTLVEQFEWMEETNSVFEADEKD